MIVPSPRRLYSSIDAVAQDIPVKFLRRKRADLGIHAVLSRQNGYGVLVFLEAGEHRAVVALEKSTVEEGEEKEEE